MASRFDTMTANRAHRVSAFLSSINKEWLLGPFAGRPGQLDNLMASASSSGMLAYFTAQACSYVFGLDLSSAAEIGIGAGAAALAGTLAISLGHIERRRNPSRREMREAALREQLDLLLRPDLTRDPEAAAFLSQIVSDVTGAMATRTSGSGWLVRAEGEDSKFWLMDDARFEEYARTVSAQGRRLTTFRVDEEGAMVMISCKAGRLHDLHPQCPAVVRVTDGQVQIQSWRRGERVEAGRTLLQDTALNARMNAETEPCGPGIR